MIATKWLTLTYLDHVRAYVEHDKIRGHDPAEELMRAVEEMADVSEQDCDDFRRSLMAQLGVMLWRGESFRIDFNPELTAAIRKLIREESDAYNGQVRLSTLSRILTENPYDDPKTPMTDTFFQEKSENSQ